MSKKNEKQEARSDENLLFEGRIREIEQEIVNFQLELARSNFQSETLQKIISALLIHGKLTQSQIKQLANISKSTISTGLLNLVNLGHVKKEKIQGSREYKYFISPAYKESMTNALGSLENEIQFLQTKLLELTNGFSPEFKGFVLLTSRIMKIIQTFSVYQKILEKLEDDTIKISSNEPILDITEEDIKKIDEVFDFEIKRVEDEIIDFFLYNSAYSTMEELTMRVYIYFFTRKVLTQKRLRELTGLSLGKISQIIKFLIEMGIIERLNKKKNKNIIPANKLRQKIYSMNSIQRSFFRSGLISGNKILKSKTKFEELKNELEINKTELMALNGYENIREVLDIYFRLFSIFHKVEQLFKEFT